MPKVEAATQSEKGLEQLISPSLVNDVEKRGIPP